MTDSHLNQVRVAAERFRRAIESADFLDLGLSLKDFPHRCCHHAAKLLGVYLLDQGLGLFSVAAGRRGEHLLDQHVWLAHGDVVVDITADQFMDSPGEKVIVTRNSEWHSRWQPLSSAGVVYDRAYYECIQGHYVEVYRRILEAIDVEPPRA